VPNANWTPPLRRARRDAQNGYLICMHRSPDEEDVEKTNADACGRYPRPCYSAMHVHPWGTSHPHAIVATLIFRHVRHYKDMFLLL
jgi:hypothetical protein